MDYDETPVSRYSNTIRFVAVAIVLVILLVLGIFFSKKIVTSMTDTPSSKTATTTDKKTAEQNKAEQEKQAATNKATQEKQAKEKADKLAVEQKQAEEAKKQEEAKKAQAAASSQPKPAPSVASTGPSAVASTGPEDVPYYLVALIGLSFAGVTFQRSRRELRRTLQEKLSL